MKLALLRCCTTPIFLKQYESSTNAILKKLGIELVDIKDFSCCGYPLRNYNFRGNVLASARNLALVEKHDVGLFTFCNCCYGNLKHAEHVVKNNPSVRREINTVLTREGLAYNGEVKPRHLLHVLYHDIGIKKIRQELTGTFRNLKIAVHYGCHLLRPSDVVQFDNPFSPSIFDQLVEVTGAQSIPWSTKLDCCGSPLWGVNDELSLDLLEKKLLGAKGAGAHCLCVACSYCQLQFDRIQRILLSRRGAACKLPSLLYTQLLGLALGIDKELLGLERNELPMTDVATFLVPGEILHPHDAAHREAKFEAHGQRPPA